MRQHAQLRRGQQTIGHRNPQHGRKALNVQAIAQPQRPEVILRQRSVQKTLRLVTKLLHALLHQRVVDWVISVHGGYSNGSARRDKHGAGYHQGAVLLYARPRHDPPCRPPPGD